MKIRWASKHQEETYVRSRITRIQNDVTKACTVEEETASGVRRERSGEFEIHGLLEDVLHGIGAPIQFIEQVLATPVGATVDVWMPPIAYTLMVAWDMRHQVFMHDGDKSWLNDPEQLRGSIGIRLPDGTEKTTETLFRQKGEKRWELVETKTETTGIGMVQQLERHWEGYLLSNPDHTYKAPVLAVLVNLLNEADLKRRNRKADKADAEI